MGSPGRIGCVQASWNTVLGNVTFDLCDLNCPGTPLLPPVLPGPSWGVAGQAGSSLEGTCVCVFYLNEGELLFSLLWNKGSNHLELLRCVIRLCSLLPLAGDTMVPRPGWISA